MLEILLNRNRDGEFMPPNQLAIEISKLSVGPSHVYGDESPIHDESGLSEEGNTLAKKGKQMTR